MKTTTLVVDLDGVICEERPTFERALAKPLPAAVIAMCNFHKLGYTIIIYTGRGWAEYNMTRDWLNRNCIPFDQLIMGKPIGDYWIDDRAIEFESWEQVWNRLRDNNQ